MTDLDKARRSVFSVARQLASPDVRRRALATLKPGDVVQAVDTETGETIGTRRLTVVDMRRESFGADVEGWPCRYIAEAGSLPPWLADDEGRELCPWVEHRPGGWVLVRAWLAPAEEARLLAESARPPPREPWTWALYEQHMEAVAAVVLSGGTALPEEPWTE